MGELSYWRCVYTGCARKKSWYVNSFYNDRRNEVIGAQPNKAHIALAEAEEFFDIQIITQNVDDLHTRAGSSKILHLHGELLKARSTNPLEIDAWVEKNTGRRESYYLKELVWVDRKWKNRWYLIKK